MSQYAYSIELFNAEVIAASGSATSAIQSVNSRRPLGNFASQLLVAGAGSTVTIELFLSINNGDSFVSYGDLFTSKAVGEYLESHGMAVCMKYYVVATETAAAEATVSFWIGVQ